MTDELIVDFPCQRNLHRVHFSETSQLHIYKRHKVARRELWFTKSDYDLMKLEVQEDVLKVRAGRTSNSNEPADADADGNADADEDDAERSSLWIGIAHLLTPASINEVRACRARCTRAVLTEQARARARQDPFLDPELGWEAISCASLAQTRKATLRAMKLGKFHRDPLRGHAAQLRRF